LAIIFAALFILAPCVWAAENKPTEEENTLLKLILKQSYPDGGYTVVAPDTSIFGGFSDASEETKKFKSGIAANLNIFGTNNVAITELIDRLYKRNEKPTRLTIQSVQKDGYLIDFDRKFEKYFAKDGGGWEKWYKENPKAHGFTNISLPVYDRMTGLVIVYKGTQSHWLAGRGNLILYRFQNGELKELTKAELWIS
jgi:hypothetical protein